MAFQIFASDSDGEFPMTLSTNQGGSLEFVNDPNAIYRHFLAMSNELSTPKIMTCPQDKSPWLKEATQFTLVSTNRSQALFDGNNRISYFIGLNANAGPGWILAGDNNLLTEDRPLPTHSRITSIPSGQPRDAYNAIRWAGDRHDGKGNVTFGDGRVETLTAKEMRQRLKDAPESTVLGLP